MQVDVIRFNAVAPAPIPRGRRKYTLCHVSASPVSGCSSCARSLRACARESGCLFPPAYFRPPISAPISAPIPFLLFTTLGTSLLLQDLSPSSRCISFHSLAIVQKPTHFSATTTARVFAKTACFSAHAHGDCTHFSISAHAVKGLRMATISTVFRSCKMCVRIMVQPIIDRLL